VHVNRGLLGWGVFFIVAGVVPLAVRNGALDAARLEGVFGLWPLILVGIGLGLLLAETKAAVLGGLVVAVTCGVMAGALLTGVNGLGIGSFTGSCGLGGPGDSNEAFEASRGAFTGRAAVRLEMRCGSVDAVSEGGPGWALSGSAGSGLAPVVVESDSRLLVTAPARDVPAFRSSGAQWDLTLPEGVPLDLELEVDAGSGDLALDQAQVASLDVGVNAGDGQIGLKDDAALETLRASVNAGSLTLDLPAAPFRGQVSVNAGSAEVCLPPGTAVRVHAGDVSLGSTNLAARGLVQQGSTWTTPGFADAPVKVELDVSVNLGSFALDPENGCG
jgi:hypothetical protein